MNLLIFGVIFIVGVVVGIILLSTADKKKQKTFKGAKIVNGVPVAIDEPPQEDEIEDVLSKKNPDAIPYIMADGPADYIIEVDLEDDTDEG